MKRQIENRRNASGIRLRRLVVIFIILILGLVLAFERYFFVLNNINYIDVPEIIYPEVTVPVETTAPASVDLTDPVKESDIAVLDDSVNFLVVGQAARTGEEARLADAIILCTLDPCEKTLRLTSILRDSFVKMPDYRGHTGGRIKLTSINHLGYVFGDGIAGSMELMNLTIFHNFGIKVDYNFEVDFDCFVDLIESIGGVDLEITEAEANYLNQNKLWVHQEFSEGEVRLDGMEALCFARMRKAKGDGESDVIRTSRQRKLIGNVLKELRKKNTSGLNQIAYALLPKIATSMKKDEITDVLLPILPMLPELKIIEGGTCPAVYSADMVDIYGDGVQHSVLRFDEATTKNTMRRITKGESS